VTHLQQMMDADSQMDGHTQGHSTLAYATMVKIHYFHQTEKQMPILILERAVWHKANNMNNIM